MERDEDIRTKCAIVVCSCDTEQYCVHKAKYLLHTSLPVQSRCSLHGLLFYNLMVLLMARLIEYIREELWP